MGTPIEKYADYVNNVSGNILLGCDGFVDEVYQIVDVRKSLTEYTAMDKVKQFGDLIFHVLQTTPISDEICLVHKIGRINFPRVARPKTQSYDCERLVVLLFDFL